MITLTPEQLLHDLAELFDCQAFELHKESELNGNCSYAVPYIMNDALECYILLKQCTMTGQYFPDFKGETSAQIIQENTRKGLIIHQGESNVFTIWFESASKILHCYQYHSIGHFWVNGQEQWRRLVYIVGTICDKYDYLGKEVCNDKELELIPLMGFAPFRMWSPIHEPLDERYPDSTEGAVLMYQLALEAGNKQYARLIRLYLAFPSKWLAKHLGKKLAKAGMETLYELIYSKITSASSPYPARDYGLELNEQIKKNRSDVTSYLHQNGFFGTYPIFHKENIQVIAAEEHPFTIMEWKHFNFKIRFMISECEDGCKALNAGFFQHCKRKSRIIDDLTLL